MLYEAYFNQLDKTPANMVSAMEGAKFLKRSGLSDAILSKVSGLDIKNRLLIDSLKEIGVIWKVVDWFCRFGTCQIHKEKVHWTNQAYF